jgi:hypothetical protein
MLTKDGGLMTYEKTNWIHKVTPLNVENLNKIEKGIKDLSMDDYILTEYNIPGETTKLCKVQKLTGEYSIFEIEAPTLNPLEATMTLMLPPTNASPAYFMDLSMMNYDDYARCSMVFQTRGGALFPVNIMFNDGIARRFTFEWNPDGTTKLLKAVPSDNRKFGLGTYGYLQDVLKNNDNLNLNNNASCFLYNCYCSDQATNTYTRIQADLTCRKIQMDSEGYTINEIWAETPTFSGNGFVEVMRVSYTELKYRGNDIAVIKRKAGAFILSEIGTKNIGIDETNNRIYVNVGGAIKYAQLT